MTPPPLLSKRGLKLVCNINSVYGNLKSDNSQDYAQTPQRNCTFMNSASGEYVDSDMVHQCLPPSRKSTFKGA